MKTTDNKLNSNGRVFNPWQHMLDLNVGKIISLTSEETNRLIEYFRVHHKCLHEFRFEYINKNEVKITAVKD